MIVIRSSVGLCCGRRLATPLVAGILLLATVAVPASGTAVASSDAAPASTPSPTIEAPPVTAQNNTTVRHRNPANVSQLGDLQAVQAMLAGSLATRLEAGAINLSQREYQRARTLLGPEYNDSLRKLVDVAGDTSRSDDDETAEQFAETQGTQRSYTDTVETVRDVEAAYREAKATGNDRRARALALDLARQIARANRTSHELRDEYRRLENRTGADLSGATRAVDETQRDLTELRRDIVLSERIRTDLEVLQTSSTASFIRPLRLQGELRTTNGTTIANRRVEFSVGAQRIRTTTGPDGTFSFLYRPVRLPANTSTVTVRYLPTRTSRYLGATRTVRVDVQQVSGTVSLGRAPSTVAFGDRVRVTGTLRVGDRPVASMPISLELGPQRLGVVRTDETGRFTLSMRMPADIPSGTQPLSAVVGIRDRAVTATGSNQSVDVLESETALSLTASHRQGRTIQINGSVTTADGRAVPSQSVDVRIDGTRVTTLTTTDRGRFRQSVTLPVNATADGQQAVTVRAVFTGNGTNLAPASTTTTARLPAPDAAETDRRIGSIVSTDGGINPMAVPAAVLDIVTSPSIPTWVWPLAVIGIGALLVIARTVIERTDAEPDSAPAATATGNADANDEGHADAAADDPSETNAEDAAGDVDADEASPRVHATAAAAQPTARSPLDVAEGYLNAGDETAAVEAAYAIVRERLTHQLDLSVGPAQTHWEFVQRCEAGLGDDALSTLEDLTRTYERAAYSPDAVTTARATDALDAARRLCSAPE